ncbi:MAG: glycosyltransferase family 4 protein [Clostridia bacterium]|nr:glycosyltransferase family 4 protein [Clostridia bacterium]
MIKVVEVSSDSNIGGAGKCILTFLKTFDRQSFDVCAVVPKGSLLKPEIEALHCKVFEAEHLAEKSLDIKAISRLRKLFRHLKPDVVHTHASMSARIAARSLGIPVVYTRHSVFPQSKKLTTFPGKQINGLINNLTATRIIAVAEAAKDNLTETGVSEKKIRVILNGVEPLQPCPEEEVGKLRMQYHIRPDEKVAVIAARLNPVKGHKYFVEAAKILKDKGIKAKFLIAGTGEEEAALKGQIKQLGLEDTVILMGFVQNVAPLMQLMDVQVNCSYGTEATSLSLLEGMSLGKPAVVTDFGGNPGVIFDGINGFLTPTHDPAATAECIAKLFCDEALYETISDNCKKVYQNKFTARVNTQAIEGIYREATKK